MAKNTTPIIIGAVLFGLLALGLTFFVLSGGGGGTAQPTAVVQATPAPPSTQWVANRTIYPRTLITRDMLSPSSNTKAVPGAIADAEDAVGLIASRTILRGKTITTEAVTTPVERVIPANIPIPVGLRGIAIWVNPDETAAGLVDVGDRVDVIATHELRVEKQGGQVIVGAVEYTAGRTIAQDIEVLAVDPSITQYRPGPAPATAATPEGAAAQPTPIPGASPTPPPGGAAPAPAPGQRRFIRVILAASPTDAQRIAAANRSGEINLAIRNPINRDRLATGEAREYPSRVAGRPTSSSTTTAQERTEARRERLGAEVLKEAFKSSRGPEVGPATPIIPTPNMGNNIGNNNGSYAPQPSNNKEVTVIRGTEKTRVIVPR